MSQSQALRPHVVAGLVHALCTCCAEAMQLVGHADLDATRMLCPTSGQTYLDRGDGVFEQDGLRVSETSARATTAEPEILSDRPKRTDDKSRILLERATFAGR